MRKLLFVGAECMPFAATGGLGDVMGSLPKAIAKKDNDTDVRVVLPLYSAVKDEWRNQMKLLHAGTVALAWRTQYCGIFSLEKDGVTYYFLDNEYYFARNSLYGFYDDAERYAFFCTAVMEMLRVLDWFPDILHANDWQSALTVVYSKTKYAWDERYRNIRCVFTIHNIEYQGQYDFSILGDVFGLSEEQHSIMEYGDCINLMKGAIQMADKVTTVSERYAEEIRTEEFSHGLSPILNQNAYKLCGILNGIDYDYYNSGKDASIAFTYTSSKLAGKKKCKKALQNELGLPESETTPVLSVISRLASHKGLDILSQCLEDVVANGAVQLVILGKGEEKYENYFRYLQDKFPDKVRALITYDRDLSKRIYSATDIFLMPSRTEPCGLSQMIASRYGAVPVVRETGGLYDSIKPLWMEGDIVHGNGLTFANYSPWELKDKIVSAIRLYYDFPDTFKKLVKVAMTTDFSWDGSAEKYIALYNELN